MAHSRMFVSVLVVILAIQAEAFAEDVRIQLSPGDGFVVQDSTGTIEHFRIDEGTGDVRRVGLPFLRDTSGLLALGRGAGGAVQTGTNSTAFGANALGSALNTSRDSAFGFNALSSQTAGSLNAAFGSFALSALTTGNSNSAFGALALASASGTDNVAVGRSALSAVGPGSRNIAIGGSAGASLQSGSDNIYIGNFGGAANESSQIRIGMEGTHTHTFLTGQTSTTDRLGVGTTAPSRELTVADTDASGDAALNLVATSPAAREMVIAVNQSTGGLISMQTNNALDFRTNANSRMHITADGRVGIETTTPSHPFQVASANGAHVTAGGTWTNGSSRSFKAGFETVDAQQVLDRVAALPIGRWRYSGQESEGTHLGPVAEDFYEAFGLGGDERYIATVDADGVALAAVQGLHALVEQQRDQIERQERQLEQLGRRVQELESRREQAR